MAEDPHFQLTEEDFILHNHLDAARTILANERTFLAYVRTALTLFVVGASLIKFCDGVGIDVVGGMFIPLGILTLLLGLLKYRKMNRLIRGVVGKRISASPGTRSE
jgi:putative membrane protein